MSSPAPKYDGVTVEYRERSSPVWDMSQERAFIESLLNQRFNFFLVFFSLVLAGSVNAKSKVQFELLLSLGALVSILFALVLWRSQVKLDLILRELGMDPTHPVKIIDELAGRRGSRRRYIGIYIPVLFCFVLIFAAAAAWCGCLYSSPP